MHAWDRYKPWNATVNHKIKAEWELKKKNPEPELKSMCALYKRASMAGSEIVWLLQIFRYPTFFSPFKDQMKYLLQCASACGERAQRGLYITNQLPHLNNPTLTSWKWIIATAINKSNNQKRHIVFSMYMKRINQTCGAAAPHEGEQTGQ